MKKLLAMLVIAALVMPMALATSVGSSLGLDITTEDFEPLVWLCDSRVVYDDGTEPGRMTMDGEDMIERLYNYAFEGEQIQWTVLVMDKNGINKVSDVFGEVNDAIEVNCVEAQGETAQGIVLPSCNARILEEDLTNETIDPTTQRYYTCTSVSYTHLTLPTN